MRLFNSEMTLFVFIIIIVELIVLGIQFFYFLLRPTDKNRLWFLLFILAFLFYNVVSAFFPDKNISWISEKWQNTLAYGSGIIVSVYLVLYVYLAFELTHLRRFAVYGLLFWVIIPYLGIFMLFYTFSENLEIARKLIAIPPFAYGLAFIYNIGKAFRMKFLNIPKQERYWMLEQVIAVYIATFSWMSIAFASYYGWGQISEQGLTNAGFLAMTVIYVRIQVLKSRFEFREFEMSRKELKEKAKELTIAALKVEETSIVVDKIHKAIESLDGRDKREVKKIIKEYFKSGIDYHTFNKNLDIVLSGFYSRLKTMHSNLTVDELRHCAYIRLAMPSQKIAHLFGISMESLKTKRYRLKKKLKITDQKLNEYLKCVT